MTKKALSKEEFKEVTKKRRIPYVINVRKWGTSNIIVHYSNGRQRKEIKKLVVSTWTESVEESFEEENKNKVANMYFL